MAAEPKPKAALKKKRRRASREEFVDYVVEVADWDWGYSLLLNTFREPDDPYHEFRHLQITGKLTSSRAEDQRHRVVTASECRHE